jgi:hypothetical protein
MNGYGIYKSAKGDVYYGEWSWDTKNGKGYYKWAKMAMNTGDIGAMTYSREKEYPRRAEYYTEMITIKESELQGVKYSEAFDFHYSV